ncbi:hypothetical protein NA57DRAFT_71731 [Rhizodiscina lignyota]|uniref:Uncharacterized protein n=1 Tax=Rhizodiscina lignyota TaxID=1504668 RepID=A0A9P4MA15_9PEZI|nr:hypothetical protein NA57DRAFT_71731 [Rhizodiscina lignyota]
MSTFDKIKGGFKSLTEQRGQSQSVNAHVEEDREDMQRRHVFPTNETGDYSLRPPAPDTSKKSSQRMYLVRKSTNRGAQLPGMISQLPQQTSIDYQARTDTQPPQGSWVNQQASSSELAAADSAATGMEISTPNHSINNQKLSVDPATVAAAHAHFQLVEQLSYQVKTLEHQAGARDDENGMLAGTVNGLQDEWRRQTDQIQHLSTELGRARGTAFEWKTDTQTSKGEISRLNEELRKMRIDRDFYQRRAQHWKGEYDKYDKKGRSSKDKIHALEQQVKDLHLVQSEVKIQKVRVEKVSGQLSSSQKNEQRLSSDLVRKKEEAKGLERDLGDARKMIQILKEQLQEHKEEVYRLESAVEGAALRPNIAIDIQAANEVQEPSLQFPEDPEWMPEADADIQRKLDNIWQSMLSWSKGYAKTEAIDSLALSSDEQKSLERVLEPVSGSNNGQSSTLATAKLGTKGPSILLLASLSNAIYTNIFDNPFFFATHTISQAESEELPSESAISFYDIYIDMLEIDYEAANAWRVQTVRSLDPISAPNVASSRLRKMKSNIKNARSTAAVAFARQFLSSDARIFLVPEKEVEERFFVDLVELMTRAAELAFKLSTQRQHVTSHQLKDLPRKGSALRFSYNSEFLQHHALHNLQLSEDEHCLDGAEVQLVVHPAVVAVGDAEGRDFSKRRVWKKAVVWMG